jgi:DNA-binding transcriptional LysR family regulator
MVRNETRLMESAIALAEDLPFSRAARRVGISQPMLTKNIQDLEALLGGVLFVRDRKNVELSDAGRAFVEQARLSLLYSERAVQAARAVMRDVDVPLYIGRSPYIDPFLVSTLLAIRLPLFPRMKIELVSQYSVDLANDLLAGALDLALATEPPESPLLTRVQVSEAPFYIAMSKHHKLAKSPDVSVPMLQDQRWILFERRLHPPVYDRVLRTAELENCTPKSIAHVTAPEEAFPSVAEGSAVAFVVKAGALLLARSGVTVRPLRCEGLQLKTYLVSRADNETKVASELVRAYMRKMTDVKKETQLKLPITA